MPPLGLVLDVNCFPNLPRTPDYHSVWLPLGFPSLLRSGPPAPPHCPICDYAPAPEEKTCSECGYDFSDTGNAEKIQPGLL